MNCSDVKSLNCFSSNVEDVRNAASVVLHSILLYQAGSEADMVGGGGIEKCLILLQGDNVKLLAIIMDCLRVLLSRSEEVKVNI